MELTPLPVCSKVKRSQREDFTAISMILFNVKMLTSSDKTAKIAAAMLISLAAIVYNS